MKNTIFALLVFVFISAYSNKSFAQDPNWSVNPSKYQFSATYTSSLNVFGFSLESANDKVAAFVNNEIRGVGSIVYVASADKYVAYLTVYANTNGEVLDFKIYSSSFNTVVDAKQTAIFKVDDNVGSVFQSFVLSNETLSDKASFADFNFQGIRPISKRIYRKDDTNNEVDIFEFLLPQGTDIGNLTPEFSTFFNATPFITRKKQISGSKALDFTNTVIYNILSENETVLEDTKIIVNVANNNSSTTTIIRSNTLDYELPVVIDIQFSNDIFGFEREDFNLTNAVISTFKKIDNKNFKVELFPVSEGEFSIAVNADVVADSDNLLNSASNELVFKSDNTAPIITSLELKNENETEYFDITFSEEVINLDILDFELTGTIKEDYYISSLMPVVNNNFRLNVVKFGANTGSFFLKLKADSDVSDLANNFVLQQETASFYVNNSVLIAPVLENIYAECSVTITDIPRITNSISGEIIGTTTDSLVYTEQGEYIVNWFFEDTIGNTVVAKQKVIIKDSIVPQIDTLQDLTSECFLSVSIPKATDNCSGEILGTTTDSLTYSAKGEYTINWSFDDGNGNISSSTQKVTITDLIPPEYVVLPEVKAHCSVNLITPKTTDNCEGVVIGTTSDPIFYDTPGVYHVNWVFNDGNGNITTTTQVVTIDNSFSPIAPILEDVITQCTVSVSEIPETSDHDCSGKVVATTTDALSYNTQGEYIIVWNFDFGDGLVLQSNQNIIVKDTTEPILPVLEDLIDECSVTVSEPPTTTDNCSGTIIGTTTDALSYTNQGNYTINWFFDDGNGNVTTAIQNIIVKDITKPIALTNDFTLELDVLGNGVLLVSDVDNNSTDNCEIATYNLSKTNFMTTDLGENTVVFTVTDTSGNSTDAIVKILVTQTSLSLDDFVLGDKILVYPNPVKNKISILIDDVIEIKKLIIYNVKGRKIWSSKYYKQEVNTTNLSKGIYFLNFKTSKGNFIKKFIKI